MPPPNDVTSNATLTIHPNDPILHLPSNPASPLALHSAHFCFCFNPEPSTSSRRACYF